MDRKFISYVDEKVNSVKKEIISCLKESSKEKINPIEDLFEEVYEHMTPNLEKQERELKDHLREYSDAYPEGRFYSRE